MAAIRAECSGIGKQDITMTPKEGKAFTIKGHTVEAVLAEIRPLFDRHGVGITPNLVERAYTGNRCDVIVDWEFENLDVPGDVKVIRWGGAGTDNGDKAFSKAGTNSLKEALKKTFLVTDREDAKEEEDKIEHRTDTDIGRAELEKAKADRAKAIQKWAATFKAALGSAKTLDDLKALERENREQLTAEDLPPVTREFFFDLIQRRKGDFAPKDGDQ